MKKVLIALLSVLFLTTAAFAQTEILVNGDFETWTDTSTPTGWDKVESTTQESTEIHGGTYSAKQLGGTSDLGQYVAVTGGNSYTISLWYKVVENDGTDARIWSYWYSDGSTLSDNANELRGPNNSYLDNNGGVWTQYTVTLDAPATADSFYFEVRTYSGATTYWDDFSVVENASAPEDPNDYFIPKGSHEKGWATLAEAVDSINANGVTGEINLILDADTLREVSFTFNADLDADNNVTVKPAEGRDVVLIVTPGVSHGNGAQMIGFDKGYVTFDGSNDGSDSRNLIVTTETNDTRVPFGINAAGVEEVMIKNLIIKNLNNVTIGFKYGVVSNDVGGNSFSVENCQIGSPDWPVWRDGIAFWGDWTNGFSGGDVIGCDIHAGARGVTMYIAGPITVANNNITMYPSASGYDYCYAINHSWVSSSDFYGNTITYAEDHGTSGVITLAAFNIASNPVNAEYNVYNNIFSTGVTSETSTVYGMRFWSANDAKTFNIYHNTFEVKGANQCYGIANSSTGAGVINLKNNIIINDNAGNTAPAIIDLVAAKTLNSNNNILVSAEKLASYGGTDYANLADWKAAGYDTGSDSVDVTFVSATDLHLAAPSDTDLDLVMAALADVPADIDGDMRGTFFAYAGADEGSAYPASNDLNLTFDDATDVANWSHYDETNGWTVEANVDGTLRLSDAGYSMLAKRPIKATVGSIYKLSLDIKSSVWEGAPTPLEVTIQGLGNDDVKTLITSEGDWTTFEMFGIADAEDGYIRIYGNNVFVDDTVWVDNVVWDDQYMELIPSASVADARMVPDGDDVACIGVVTATTVGSPQFMQDETAGIAVHDSYLLGEWEEGDEVLVIGESDDYNGLIEIKYPIEFQILSKNNVVEPTLITVPDLDSRDYQGMLVMVESVDTVAGEFSWPSEGSSSNIDLTDGTNEFLMRIDSDGDMDGATPPNRWPLDLIGVVTEYYSPQIMPRYMEDFITNYPPQPFNILNPADSAVITSFDDPEVEYIEMDGDSVYAMFVNWTEAIDLDGDTLEYEMLFIGDGPDETVTTADTFIYIPLDQEEPYNMNGTYTYYFSATDPMGEMSVSDTHDVTFDFPAPPMIEDAQVVLVDGTPKYYVEFDLPLDEPEIANFSIYDSDADATIAPTAVDSIAPNAVLLTAALVEDHNTDLYTTGLTAPGATVTVPDTSYGNRVYIPFSDAHPEDEAKMLENFETDKGLFQTLKYSGSTGGILDASTFDASADAAYIGDKSGKMVLLDDPAVNGGWFVRIPYDYPYYNTEVKANSVLMFVLKGTAADVNITLTIKDTGYERAMWKNVTLCENDWQVVAFDLANDPVEGWITGDGTVTGETVKIADIHISCDTDEDVTLYIDGFTERQVLSPVDITLNVIMKKWVEEGWFNLAMDYVDVAGTFNEWDGTDDIASDFDGDTTYTVTVPMMPYGTEYFKFRINGSWDDGKHEFDHGRPARELVVPATASEFTFWFNDDTLEVAAEGIPTEFALHQNYPNPFNPTTTINFDLPEIADVKLIIYDITGRKVRTLVNNSGVAAGYKKIVWNGRDDFGNGVATGMYIYRLIAGDFVEVKKMTFLK